MSLILPQTTIVRINTKKIKNIIEIKVIRKQCTQEEFNAKEKNKRRKYLQERI